ncbi:hypothetical protein CCMA1212_008354 [Trichoderma ghanense]|uniref:Uncharacterized protein n=1 Tax=Trichoderma ghanense TaxID=65468 RepID=A0ABY2GVF5_9HYPO
MASFLRNYHTDKPMLLEKDVNSLKHKVFIITGGSGGIGLELAKILYHANATRIYLLSRSRQSGNAAIAAITNSEPPPDMKLRSAEKTDAVRFIPLDLGDLNSVKEAAKSFLQIETRLDVIWHNAAVMLAPEGSVSKQGHELTFATNVFGPFLLQHFLTPIMLKTSRSPETPKGSVRVCWAASGEAVAPPGDDGIVWDDWQLSSAEYGGFKGRTIRYVQSKAANVILAAEMAKVYPEIISCAFNPGAIKTDIARHAPWFLQALHIFMSRPVRFGALTELYAGFSDEVAEKNGCFIVPFGQIGTTFPKVEAGIAERNSGKRLWALCDGHVRECNTFGTACVFERAIARPRQAKPAAKSRRKAVEEKIDGLLTLISSTPIQAKAREAGRPTHVTISSHNTNRSIYQDVIVKGIITAEEARQLLTDFVTASAEFPLVLLSSRTNLEYLRVERPCLLLAILTACARDRLQTRLEQEFRNVLAERLIVNAQKNVDLLQSLLVFLGWNHLYLDSAKDQIYQFAQIATTMAVELKLGPPDKIIQDMLIQRHETFKGTTHDKEYHAVVERMRVYVMCYYVSSCNEKAHSLQLQALVEEVEQLFQYNSGQLSEAMGYMQVQAMIKTFKGKLDQLVQDFPPQAKTNMLAAATLGGVAVGDSGQFRELADIPVYLTSLRDKMMCMGTMTDTGEDRRDYFWKMMQFFKHCLNWVLHHSGNEARSIGGCAASGDANMSFQRILENIPSEEVTQDDSLFSVLDMDWLLTTSEF